jgi:hypothetical protein
MDIPNDVEILYIDDGSNPPTDSPYVAARTNDTRPWTWALARNLGARICRGEYVLMTDLDYIILPSVIEDARQFDGDRMGFKREFGILDESGEFTQDIPTLLEYGLMPSRIPTRGVKMPPHPNNFVMRKDLFWEMGGYIETRIGRDYPQGEDRLFKKRWMQFVGAGKAAGADYRPMLYMFPNGQFCGDVDYNPHGLFHNLSRRKND